ncbi:Hypothetical predicted protein [Paramuricea clavata]|uniref:Uncharacterized protein n=1 Tax=Paramuricea clavata TaxID=317549 RepID=A0A7D9LD21_PARCT|nr:Hypothetical predicted protein [Paramuricea clavata]
MSLKKTRFGSEIKRLASERKRRRELRCFGMNEIDDERRQYYMKWKERRARKLVAEEERNRLEQKRKRLEEKKTFWEKQYRRIDEIKDKLLSEKNYEILCRRVEMEKKGFEFRLDLENDERDNTRALRKVLGPDRYLEDGGYDEIEILICPNEVDNTEEEVENYIDYGILVYG